MKKLLGTTALFAFPSIAFAQVQQSNLIGVISFAQDILNRIIPVLIALALVIFFWGLVKYIRSGKAAGGKDIMIAGLVGLFIMVSVWGIIRLAQNTLRVDNRGGVGGSDIPQVPIRQ